jgi:pimeloyl-ACP methyl ester carboxylesterase
MESVRHNGRETAYRSVTDRRDGPTVLYVHGSGGTHRVWANQYGAGDLPSVALDLSGHGASDDIDRGPGDPTLDAYADDALAVANAVDADVLVGNSLGGAVTLWVLLERAWDPDAVVLTGTGPTLPVFEDLREWLDADFDRAVSFLHGRDRLFHSTEATLLARSRETMQQVGQRVTRRDFLTCDQFDVSESLSAVDAPALALCGEHDKLTPRSVHEQLARGIPGGEFALVPDAAHLAMLERPGVFNDIVAAFLRDVSGA